MSRDKFKRVFLKEHPTHDPLIPGPGSYSPVQAGSFNQTHQRGFTLKAKLHDSTCAFYSRNKGIPGPGSYEEKEAMSNSSGFYVSSRYTNPGCPSMSRQGQRFKQALALADRDSPGPGHYEQDSGKVTRDSLTRMGKINKGDRLNNLETSLTRRCKFPHSETPGPGMYQAHSDFGYKQDHAGSGYFRRKGNRSIDRSALLHKLNMSVEQMSPKKRKVQERGCNSTMSIRENHATLPAPSFSLDGDLCNEMVSLK